MPLHLIPVAIVVVKVSASAVVSLSPASMTMDGDGENQEPRTKLRDFLKPSFYKREFARLDNERVTTSMPPVLSIDIPLHQDPLHQDQSSTSLESGERWDHGVKSRSNRFRTIHRDAEVEMV
eukprot:CAMPEP_0119012278 /NCGR_PEP_ID=MMETSP1176-20130426/6191_1 /TAXON_ID=265551 /ORGANISM="Synedropsis recta cf, Strain CCMP1620" /LENGTH=121 /DNA_ID=CAMNT_0006965199 /DNA_START=50 /DNA_END=415 /DNA_ORIENTATION=+